MPLSSEHEEVSGEKGFRVYNNQRIVLDRKANDTVDDMQLFCDFFCRGGLGIDLALSHGLKSGLIE
ncbi:MAG: hypothetical protein GON13_03125 [Nanoarchaeota archaeon]|nr:hypothetical protein [Nanoarchaeota archaeon]